MWGQGRPSGGAVGETRGGERALAGRKRSAPGSSRQLVVGMDSWIAGKRSARLPRGKESGRRQRRRAESAKRT